MKIVYFGNDLFSNCLLLLIKNRLNIERVFINDVQENASFIKRICRKYNIVYSTEKPSIVTLKGYLNDEQTVFVVADYGYKVPTNEIKYAINIHPSLLPKSRGPTPLTYIIDNPENAGVSIHKLTEKLDAGSILIQEKFEVEDNETISSLMVKSQLLAETLLEELLNNFNELYNNATPQLEKLASFQSLPPVKRRFVNWDQNTTQFSHALRQYGHFGILISLDNALYIANDVEVTTFSHDFTCGSIIFEDALIKSIAINDGYVVLSKRSLRLYESRVLN